MSKIKALLSKTAAALAPPKPVTPTDSGDRPVRIDERGRRIVTWPDDDLGELEHPEHRDRWLGRVPKDWLWGARRR